MRYLSVLTAGAALLGALASGGLALAQPVNTGDATIDPVDTGPTDRISITVGVGAGVAPDYEGSSYYVPVPLWNLTVANLYHPKTYVALFGPRLRSNFLPDDHWRLGLAGQFIRERNDVHNNKVDDLENVDASVMLGAVGGYDFLADPQQDLVLELEVRQDVANDNGLLATFRGVYGSRLAPGWRLDAFVWNDLGERRLHELVLWDRRVQCGPQRARPVQRRRGLQGRQLRRHAHPSLP